MKIRNDVALMYLNLLTGFIEKGYKGKFGYVLTVNLRKIKESLQEFLNTRNELIMKYGEKKDENYFLNQEDKGKYKKFIEEITPLATIEQHIDIMKIPANEVWDQLDSEAMIQLEWMLDEPQN